MSAAGLFRAPSRLHPRRRTRAGFRPAIDGLEDRVVMSSAASLATGQAEVHVLAARKAANVDVPIALTGIAVTNVTRDAAGAATFSGTATGTILGQSFSTPVSGRLATARNGAATVNLSLQPINLNLVGLGIKTDAVNLAVNATKGQGAAGKQVAAAIKAAVASGTTADASAALSTPRLLGTVNRALDQANQVVNSYAPANGPTAAALDLTVGRAKLQARGLKLRTSGPVSVDLTGNASGGLLGNLVSGISAGTTGKALARQVNGVLQQISSTPVPTVSQLSGGTVTAPAPAPAAVPGNTLITINLNPLDINLLGLQVKTSQITVTVSAQPGSGKLLGNLLTTVSNLINLQGVNAALNNVLANVVTLANSASLSVAGVGTGGTLATPASTTPVSVLTAHIAPVHLDLLGAVVDTSPIDVSITANPGQGQVLGNVVAALAHLLDTPPKNGKIDVPYLTDQIRNLNGQLASLAPTVTPAPSAPHTVAEGGRNVLSLVVAPINLNLLGLVLHTDQIQVNADAFTGSGNLLGNLLNSVLNTFDATPENLSAFNGEINNLLARVVGILNNTTLSLPSNVLSTLSQTLQTLALPDLVNTSGAPASVPVLNLAIASADGSTAPPVDVDLLGLVVTTSDIRANLVAQTGDGQILGNLVYNVSHLLDPGGALGLLTILQALAL